MPRVCVMLKLLAFALVAAPMFSEASLSTHGNLAATLSPLKAKGTALKKLKKLLNSDETVKKYVLKKTGGDVRGSKKLEDSAGEMAKEKLSRIQNSLRKLPMFKNMNSQSMEKQASSVSPATRRLLQVSRHTENFTFAGSSSGCQDAIKEMGYQPADMDADDFPDLPVPDKYKACEGFLETVLGKMGGSADYQDFIAQSDFCTQACKADSMSWLTSFGSKCGGDAATFYLDAMKKADSTSDLDFVMRVMYYAASISVAEMFMTIDYAAVGAEFGCMPSDTGVCWTRDYWWRVVYWDDDDSDDFDDSASGRRLQQDSDSSSDYSCPPADLVANNYVPTKCYSNLDYCTFRTINASSDCCYATVLAFSIAETAVECSWMLYSLDLMTTFGRSVPQCYMDQINYLCKSSSDLGDWVDGTVNKAVSCCEGSNPIAAPCAKDGSTLGGIIKAYDEIRKTTLSESSGFVAGVMPSVLLLLSLCFATLVM